MSKLNQAIIAKAIKGKLETHQLEFFCEVLEAKQKGVAPTYRRARVDIRTFLENKYYMGGAEFLWPKLIDCIVEANSGDYEEAVLTGAIGTGKSTIALYSMAYQLYLISCLLNISKTFNQDPASQLVIVFQNRTAEAAKKTGYGRFREMIGGSKYFQKYFMFDKHLKSEMIFRDNVVVRPISGEETAALGENVIYGLIDEMNFMANIDGSKRAIADGQYDQAWALYNTISKRRKSRFMVQGKLPGILFLVSSKRYPDQFTDRKVAEAEKEIIEKGSTSIYVFDKCEWEIKPIERFSGNWFDLFIGDQTRAPRILDGHKSGHEIERDRLSEADQALIKAIPLEYLPDFERDIMTALRDTAAVSILAMHPFIMNREAVEACFGGINGVLSRGVTDFNQERIAVYPKRFKSLEAPRAVHLDLATTGDCAGVSCGCIDKFVRVQRGETKDNVFEVLPNIRMDFLLEVKPPKGGEILFDNILSLILKLKEMGLNIKWVTADSWQSTHILQRLRAAGISTKIESLDKDTVGYDITKAALYDGRLQMQRHDKCQSEFLGLEKDTKKSKIDHPPTGSKDVSDSVAGVVKTLTLRREIWAMNGIPPMHIPESISSALEKMKPMKNK